MIILGSDPSRDGLRAHRGLSRAAVAERYQDQRIGLADASIVALAARYQTTRVLTLDERHFLAMRPLHADAFTILPADR
jgi:predicted nucleic acid-binding protein